MSKVPTWILHVLEQKCSSQCLDTAAEREVVASHIHRAMIEGDEPENDLSTRELAERVVTGRSVTAQGHLEIAALLLAITGLRK